MDEFHDLSMVASLRSPLTGPGAQAPLGAQAYQHIRFDAGLTKGAQ